MSSNPRLREESLRLWKDFSRQLAGNIDALCDLVGQFRNGDNQCFLLSQHSGSFNFSIRLHWEDGGCDWLIRFPMPGKTLCAEEKVQNEVALMKFIRRNTNIPVPEIVGYGTSKENLTGLGPFIIMTWVEGIRMKELLQESSISEKYSDHVRLNPNISEDTLKSLYSEVSKVLYELWTLDFDRIGSLEFDDNSNSWQISRCPLTLAQNDIVRRDGVSVELRASKTFSSSLDYFASLAEMHDLHLRQNAKGVRNSRNARAKYTTRHIFRSIIPIFTVMSENNGPFKLFCDDFRPGNVLVDPKSLKITGVIDWEFCYTAPAQFLASPPDWLLLKDIGEWVLDEGLNSFFSAYLPKFELFLQTLETHEAQNYKLNGAQPKLPERLSTRMRESLNNRTVWFNTAIRQPLSINVMYWDLLDNYVYGPASRPERVARVTGSSTCLIAGDETYSLHHSREKFVKAKIKDLQAYNAAIGKTENQVEYEEPAEDEKPEYWIRLEKAEDEVKGREGEGEKENSVPLQLVNLHLKPPISNPQTIIKLLASFTVIVVAFSLRRKFLK